MTGAVSELCPCPAGSSGAFGAASPGAVHTPRLCEHTFPWHGVALGLLRHNVGPLGHGVGPLGAASSAPCSSWSFSSPSRALHGPARAPWCRALHSWNSRAQALQQTNVQVLTILQKHFQSLTLRRSLGNCSANIDGRCGNLVTG